MKRRRFLLSLPPLVLLAGGIAYWRLIAYPPSRGGEGKLAESPAPATGTAESPEAKTRRQLLGTWQDEYRGKRTMTLNDDGTGTMIVELSGLDAFLAAPRLRFEMTWSVEGKALTKKTVGGEPKDKVNLILNTLGDTATDTIVEVTPERLLLLDKDGETRYDWRRVKGEAGSEK